MIALLHMKSFLQKLMPVLFAGLLLTSVYADTSQTGFNPLPNSEIDGENGWTATNNVGLAIDPADTNFSDGTNIVMTVDEGDAGYAYKTTPTITNDTVGTLYCRVRVKSGGTADVNFGLSDNAAPAAWTDQQVYCRIDGNSLCVYNNGGWQTLSTLTTDKWYSLWFVGNSPANDSFEIYMNDGTGITQLSDGGDTSFDYRGGTADALSSFWIRRNSAHDTEGDQVMFDDIYVDPNGKNMDDPRTLVAGLTYSTTEFEEAAPNDGSIGNNITITLTDDTFFDGTYVQGTHYTISDVPNGLSFNLIYSTASTLTATLTGASASHTAADSTTMSLTFLDDAFINGDATNIIGYTESLAINFDDPSAILLATLSEVDDIIGERQANGSALGYYTNSSDGLVGVSGSFYSETRTDKNVVMGYTLPTLPYGCVVDSVTLNFGIAEIRDSSMRLPELHTYLLDSANPDETGVTFYYQGSNDPSVNSEFVGSVLLSVGSNPDTIVVPDDDQDQSFTLSGEALELFKSFYKVNSPVQSKVFFRFNLSEDPELARAVRYVLSTASDESWLEISTEGATGSLIVIQ